MRRPIKVTEDQIRRLTHVIFAFVATHPDGSIGFGAVSDEPDQGDAAAKAMQRFTDLREVAAILRFIRAQLFELYVPESSNSQSRRENAVCRWRLGKFAAFLGNSCKPHKKSEFRKSSGQFPERSKCRRS